MGVNLPSVNRARAARVTIRRPLPRPRRWSWERPGYSEGRQLARRHSTLTTAMQHLNGVLAQLDGLLIEDEGDGRCGWPCAGGSEVIPTVHEAVALLMEALERLAAGERQLCQSGGRRAPELSGVPTRYLM